MPPETRPDKKKVTDEVWDDDRVREFLTRTPYPGHDHPDFVLLLKAYRGMRPEDFERFARFFAAHGHDFDARNEAGETFMQFVARHRQARPFLDIIAAVRSANGRTAS
jgi:hypothetical protein